MNSPNEWLQVDFGKIKKVTGIVTQGSKTILTNMFVKEFAVSSSQDGTHWSPVLQDGKEKVGRARQILGNHEAFIYMLWDWWGRGL